MVNSVLSRALRVCFLALVVSLAAVFVSGLISAGPIPERPTERPTDTAPGGIGSQALQNQKIYCWGRSIDGGVGADTGEGYPDHLGRILGREVHHSVVGSTYEHNMRPGKSNETLEATRYFEEHRYGIIIMRMAYDGGSSGIPWDATEDNLRRIIRKLQDTGAVVVFFESGPLWDLDGQLTTHHDECLTGTSHEMTHPYIVCDCIDNATQTAKYNEWWGETVFSRIAREEGAYFLSDALLDCLDETEGNCPRITNLHPDLECQDDLHPNNMGYGVLAERVAEHLVDWGLAEYPESYEEMSVELASLMSSTEAKLEMLEGGGLDISDIGEGIWHSRVP